MNTAAPRGDFTLTDATTPVVLVSAGVGATPVLAMLHALAAAHSSRAVWWFHAARRPADQPFAIEVRQLVDALPDAHLQVRYSAATAAEIAATGASARPPRRHRVRRPARRHRRVPVRPRRLHGRHDRRAHRRGLDPAHVHTERFGARSADQPRRRRRRAACRRTCPPGAPGTGPLVTFARSALSLPFDDRYAQHPRARRRLRRPHPLVLPHRRLPHLRHTAARGGVTYAPDPLEPPAAGSVLLCCATPTTDVVVDV